MTYGLARRVHLSIGMLRITSEESGAGTRFRLEGKLRGPWVTELEAVYLSRKRAGGGPIVLEIDGLTEADQAGRFLLTLIQREGAVLAHSGPRPSHLFWEGLPALNSELPK